MCAVAGSIRDTSVCFTTPYDDALYGDGTALLFTETGRLHLYGDGTMRSIRLARRASAAADVARSRPRRERHPDPLSPWKNRSQSPPEDPTPRNPATPGAKPVPQLAPNATPPRAAEGKPKKPSDLFVAAMTDGPLPEPPTALRPFTTPHAGLKSAGWSSAAH